MGKIMVSVLIAGLVASGAAGQNPPPAPADTEALPPGQGLGPGQGARAEQLRAMIEERFAQRVKTELQLNDQQMDQLRAAYRADRDRRLQLRDREMDLRRAINEQMQPGVAANQDSLSRLQDALTQNHVARAQLEQQQERDLAQFLTPVQRARLMQMRQNLMQRIQTIREGRVPPPARRPMPVNQPRARRPGRP